MAHRERVTLGLGLLAFTAGVIVLLVALVLGFHIVGNPDALVRSAKGQQIAVPGVIAVLAGIVALTGRRRGWSLVVAAVGVGAALVAVLLIFVLPSR